MSYRVLVIPEDPTLNGYLLQPLVETLVESAGRPHAKVKVLTDPHVQGYAHAKATLVDTVLDDYSHYDLLLFLPDRDGREIDDELDVLERKAANKQVALLCCAAVEEIETWCLAGHSALLKASWSSIRSSTRVKEEHFAPFLREFGSPRAAGGGRDRLMREALSGYAGIKQRCVELGQLEERVARLIKSQRDA